MKCVTKLIYALGRGKNENTEMLEFLRDRGYQWKGKDSDWETQLQSDDVNRSMVVCINSNLKEVYPVDLSTMAPYDIDSYLKRAISLKEVKAQLPTTEELKVEMTEDDQKSKLKFVRITGNQIIAKFPSKNSTDDYGNPIILAKVRLPSAKLSKTPLMQEDEPLKSPYLLVPDYMIREDQYWKKDDGREHYVVGLKAEKEYLILYDNEKRNEAGFKVDDVLKVKGKDLVEAFQFKKKEKSLDDRLKMAEDHKHKKGNAKEHIEKERNDKELSQ